MSIVVGQVTSCEAVAGKDKLKVSLCVLPLDALHHPSILALLSY
jgi:hypothetical protein